MPHAQHRNPAVERLCSFCSLVVLLVPAMLGGCSTARPHFAIQADSDTKAPTVSLQFAPDERKDQAAASATRHSSRPTRPVSANAAVRLPTEIANELPELARTDAAPAYDEPLSLRDDLRTLGPSLGGDVRALANWETAGILAVGGAASLAVRDTVDDDVSDWTLESLHRWGDATDVLGALGNPAHHFAAAGVLWASSLAAQNHELHDASGAMINALILTNASTLLLKLAANSDAPNGEAHGWPSGHTSSSFTMAAVLDEFYGPQVGIPAYALAGLVAYSRIDDREHDLSDVIFGAALGYGIGKVVAARHHRDCAGITLLPYLEPVEGTTGIALEKRF
jgi:membrane-associated phospholipid phosphatase